jgi:hypothetical protein
MSVQLLELADMQPGVRGGERELPVPADCDYGRP